jgi:hypothetical protein
MKENGEQQQWQKRLRRHNQTLLAAILALMVSYFAALFAVCYFSLHHSIHLIEQDLRNTNHWKP